MKNYIYINIYKQINYIHTTYNVYGIYIYIYKTNIYIKRSIELKV